MHFFSLLFIFFLSHIRFVWMDNKKGLFYFVLVICFFCVFILCQWMENCFSFFAVFCLKNHSKYCACNKYLNKKKAIPLAYPDMWGFKKFLTLGVFRNLFSIKKNSQKFLKIVKIFKKIQNWRTLRIFRNFRKNS